MNGFALLFVILVAVLFIVVTASVFKWHPFISLLLASLGVGLFSGLSTEVIIKEITVGFGSLLGSIGIVVVLGGIIGVFLERSGAVNRLGDFMLGLSGGKYPVMTLSVLGAVLGIPVFCDSGFIVLVSLAKVLSVKSGIKLPVMTLALSSGLYATHTLVPPTPGPLAAAGNLGASDMLGLVILTGMAVAIPSVMAAYLYARKVGVSLTVDLKNITDGPMVNNSTTSLGLALSILLVPLSLISISSALKLANYTGLGAEVFYFLGHPVLALLVGVVIAWSGIRSVENKTDWMQQGIVQSGPILLLTGCGGAFGAVLKATPLSDMLATAIQGSQATGITFLFITFIVAALLKTAQGSTTSSMVITSSLLSPFAPLAGFDTPMELCLLVSAVGSGGMVVSHANDSYFWVVSQFSGFNLKEGYRGMTGITLVQGLAAFACVVLFYVIVS